MATSLSCTVPSRIITTYNLLSRQLHSFPCPISHPWFKSNLKITRWHTVAYAFQRSHDHPRHSQLQMLLTMTDFSFFSLPHSYWTKFLQWWFSKCYNIADFTLWWCHGKLVVLILKHCKNMTAWLNVCYWYRIKYINFNQYLFSMH